MTHSLIGWEGHWSLLPKPPSQPALQPTSGSAQAPGHCVLQPPAHRPSFPSAACPGFQLCVMFVLSLKVPPAPHPSLSSKLVLTYQILVSNFSLVRPQLLPALGTHPGCGNFSSVSSLVAPCYLLSDPSLQDTPASLLNSDSPMMRRTVIYVSLQPKCLT